MDEAKAPSNVERLLSRWDGRTPLVVPAACAPVRHQASTCRHCIEICPVSAISVGETLSVDPDRCINCGLCAAVCPSGALAIRRGDVQLLREAEGAASAGQPVTFACPRYRDGETSPHTIGAPCLGAVSLSLLLSIVARGASAVHLLDAPCPDCHLARGRDLAGSTAAECNQFLAALGADQRIAFVQEATAPPPARESATRKGVGRRTFLGLAKREVFGAIAGAILPEAPEEARRERALPAKHIMLLDAIARLTSGKDDPLGAEASVPLFQPRIDGAACDGCEVCAGVCPTGALQGLPREDGTREIVLEQDRCTGCHLCAEVCSRDAISLERRRDVQRGRLEPLWRGRPADGDALVRNWAREALMGR